MATNMRDAAKDRELEHLRELFEEFLSGRVSLNPVLGAITHLLGTTPDHACLLQDMLDHALGSGRLPEQTWERLTTEIDRLISEDDPTDWSDDPHKELRQSPAATSQPDHESDIPGVFASELMPGSLLDDRYVVVSCEGAGSTGKVYKALDRKRKEAGDPNPWVAIKTLDPALCRNSTAMQTLRNEIDSRRTLSHPNIVQVFDFVQQQSGAFVSMEWINGESLAKLLVRKRHRPLDPDQAERIISGIGQALAHAHGQRIVHGDIKPGNVMITPDGEARLLDFGFARPAKSANEAHDSGSIVAYTPAWSSCEVLEGLAPTTQDDIFSLALIGYRLLTGHRAFEGADALQAESAGLSPVAVASLPRRRREALERALAFRRAGRFPDVDSFLQQFFSAPPATSPPESETVRANEHTSETFNSTSMDTDPAEVAEPAARRLGHPGRIAVAAGLAAIAIAGYLNTRVDTPTQPPETMPDIASIEPPEPDDSAGTLKVDRVPVAAMEQDDLLPVESPLISPDTTVTATSLPVAATGSTPRTENTRSRSIAGQPGSVSLAPAEPVTAEELADATIPSSNPANEIPATTTTGSATVPTAATTEPDSPPQAAATESVATPLTAANQEPVVASAATDPTDSGPVLASTQTLALADTTATESAEPPVDMGPPIPLKPVSGPLPSEIGPAAPTGPRLVSLSTLDFDRYFEPRFPRRVPAKLDKGWVLVQFDVTTEGRTANIRILESEPAGTFDEAAIKAISRWRFKPPHINGESIEARSQVRLVFKRE